MLANKNNPKVKRIGNLKISLAKTNESKRIGFTVAIISKVFFRPILSEIVPEVKVPTAPASCSVERAIPLNHKVSPSEVRKMGRNVVNEPLISELKKTIPPIEKKSGK